MRWLLGIVAVLATLWCGWWVVGQTVIEREARAALARLAADGKLAEVDLLQVQGFPNRFDLMVAGLHLADPAQGTGWQAEALQVYAMTWKPWHVIAALPGAQIVSLPGQSLTLTGTEKMASLRAAPALDLPLAEARLVGRSLALVSDAGWSLAAGGLAAAVRARPGKAAEYDLGLEVTAIAPDAALMAALALAPPGGVPSDLPPQIARLHGDAALLLSAPLDRHAGQTRPQLAGLVLRELGLDWGPLVLRASGEIAADAQGFAAGRIEVQITGWDRLPALLVATGALRADLAPTVANMLAAGAAGGADLSLPLLLRDGGMSLGPFPLGPAPRLAPPAG